MSELIAAPRLEPLLRMCWHTNFNNVGAGFRCGANDLNDSSTWERVIYEAD